MPDSSAAESSVPTSPLPQCPTCDGRGWNLYPSIEDQTLVPVACGDCAAGPSSFLPPKPCPSCGGCGGRFDASFIEGGCTKCGGVGLDPDQMVQCIACSTLLDPEHVRVWDVSGEPVCDECWPDLPMHVHRWVDGMCENGECVAQCPTCLGDCFVTADTREETTAEAWGEPLTECPACTVTGSEAEDAGAPSASQEDETCTRS